MRSSASHLSLADIDLGRPPWIQTKFSQLKRLDFIVKVCSLLFGGRRRICTFIGDPMLLGPFTPASGVISYSASVILVKHVGFEPTKRCSSLSSSTPLPSHAMLQILERIRGALLGPKLVRLCFCRSSSITANINFHTLLDRLIPYSSSLS